jgi:large subunit ribosomal protein L9
MRVILTENIRGLGQKNDVKNVADGYARNFLIPRGMAEPAIGERVEAINDQKRGAAEEKIRRTNVLEELRQSTEASPVIVPVLTGDKGEIFGSIKEAGVYQALIALRPELEALNLKVELEKPIRELGIHTVAVGTGGGVKNTFSIQIIPRTGSKTE